jgi:hypothetical protein
MVGIPSDVKTQRTKMRQKAVETIAPQTATNVVIGTWNLRAFGGLSKTWQATGKDSPNRRSHPMLRCLCAARSSARHNRTPVLA